MNIKTLSIYSQFPKQQNGYYFVWPQNESLVAIRLMKLKVKGAINRLVDKPTNYRVKETHGKKG